MTSGTQFPIPAGFYSTATGLTHDADSVTDCPQHHYCLEGSVAPTPCPATKNGVATGTYFPGTNAQSEDDCLACPKGEWCNYFAYYSVTALGAYNHVFAEANYRGKCSGGVVCDGGAIIDNVSDGSVTTCTAGYYCPDNAVTSELTLDEMRCPPGTFSAAGAASCTDCAAGTLCPGYGTDDSSQVACPSG